MRMRENEKNLINFLDVYKIKIQFGYTFFTNHHRRVYLQSSIKFDEELTTVK